MAKTDGKIYCRFQRPAAMTLKDRGKDQTFDLDMKNFYLFLGWGPLYEGRKYTSQHCWSPIRDSFEFYLNVFTEFPEFSDNGLFRSSVTDFNFNNVTINTSAKNQMDYWTDPEASMLTLGVNTA